MKSSSSSSKKAPQGTATQPPELIFADMCRYLLIFADISRYLPIFVDIYIFRDLPIFAEICRDLPRFAEICRDLPRFAETCRDLPRIGRVARQIYEIGRPIGRSGVRRCNWSKHPNTHANVCQFHRHQRGAAAGGRGPPLMSISLAYVGMCIRMLRPIASSDT